MKKLRIGFDIDDVLINTADSLVQVHNDLYGTNLGREHVYDLTEPTVKAWQVEDGRAVTERVHEIIALSDWIEAATSFDDAAEVLAKLKEEGCELFAITGRPSHLRDSTMTVLEKFYPGIFSHETLYMTDYFELEGSPLKKITKLDMARQLKLTHFVEDLLVHADMLGEAGIKTVLFDNNNGYHWNQTGGHDSLIRLSSWKEIGEFFERERREV